MPQAFAEPTHEIDHVIAEQHRGPATPENLALACFHCNNHKGTSRFRCGCPGDEEGSPGVYPNRHRTSGKSRQNVDSIHR